MPHIFEDGMFILFVCTYLIFIFACIYSLCVVFCLEKQIIDIEKENEKLLEENNKLKVNLDNEDNKESWFI